MIKVSKIFALSSDYRDWLFVPLLIQWIVVNLVLYYPYLRFIFEVGIFQQKANVIFPYTWTSALLLFFYALYIFLKKYKIDYVRTVLYSLSMPFVATSLFEIIWQNIGSGIHVGNQSVITEVINISSIALIVSVFKFWRIKRSFLILTILYLLIWIVWLSVGYPQINTSSHILFIVSFSFNVGLKILSFILVGSLITPPFASENIVIT